MEKQVKVEVSRGGRMRFAVIKNRIIFHFAVSHGSSGEKSYVFIFQKMQRQ